MFASLKFRDVFAELSTGFVPALVAAGSSVGSAISMIGIRKVVFHLYCGGGGAGSAQLLIGAASVSGGTGSTNLSNGAASNSLLTSMIASASPGVTVVEVRGEFLENNSVGPWIFPVLSVSGGSLSTAVVAHGFLTNIEQASTYKDTASFVKSEVDLF